MSASPFLATPAAFQTPCISQMAKTHPQDVMYLHSPLPKNCQGTLFLGNFDPVTPLEFNSLDAADGEDPAAQHNPFVTADSQFIADDNPNIYIDAVQTCWGKHG